MNELLEQNQVLKQVEATARVLLDELVILDSVDSTNDYLLRLAPKQQVIACFAEQQTAAKGQRGKRWFTVPGGQIYFSLVWPFHKSANQITGLSLAMGIAVARALHHYGVGGGLWVKWPNDLYCQNKKLVGILVETAPSAEGVCNIVIGIGINLCLTPEQGAMIDQPWISLQDILQQKIARNRLAGILLNDVLWALIQFSEQGFPAFQEEWRALDYLYGKKVVMTSPQQTLTGLMCGVSTRGELLLRDDQQREHVCLNGSVRLLQDVQGKAVP